MATNDLVVGSNLGPEFEIGTGPDTTKITVKVDQVGVLRDPVTGQLSSPPGVLTFDNVTKIVTYTDGQGNTQNIDLSQFTTDVYVDGGSFDVATSTLVLTDNDGTTPDVTVDLSTLLGVSADVTNALTDGTDGKPFLAPTAFNVSTDANNLLANGADDKPFLDCASVKTCTTTCNDVFGNPVLNAFSV